MSFVKDMFDENVEYCEYVFNKNNEYNLDLDHHDIEVVANEYTRELEEQGLDFEEEVIKNDALLLETVKKYKQSMLDTIDEEYPFDENFQNYADGVNRKVYSDQENVDDLYDGASHEDGHTL